MIGTLKLKQDFNPEHNGREIGIEPILEHLSGRGKAETYTNFSGATVKVEAVIVNTCPVEPYKLYIKAGDNWIHVDTYQPNDPAIEALKLTERE